MGPDSSETPAQSSARQKRTVHLLVCDLDNTLYDWVTFFATAFYEMVQVASQLLQVDQDRLLDDLREVHQRYHNSEHPFALLETRTVLDRFPMLTRAQRALELDAAFYAFNRARKRNLCLYPGVADTLQAVHLAGVPIVGHTEATALNALFRLRSLGIEPVLSALYASESPPDDHWDYKRADPWQRSTTLVRTLGRDRRKPDPTVLVEICAAFRTPVAKTLYVGDSLLNDIGMAKDAGTLAAWAKYGTRFDPRNWDRLVRITHWTDEDIRRSSEARAKHSRIEPDFVLEDSIGEILQSVRFDGLQGGDCVNGIRT